MSGKISALRVKTLIQYQTDVLAFLDAIPLGLSGKIDYAKLGAARACCGITIQDLLSASVQDIEVTPSAPQT